MGCSRRSRANLGSFSLRSDSFVLHHVSMTSPPTTCRPRCTCTQPERQSMSSMRTAHASQRRSQSAAPSSTAASNGCPTMALSVTRSCSAVSVGRRTVGFFGSSTPCVTSQIRSWWRRKTQRYIWRNVLYDFYAEPGMSNESIQSCTCSNVIVSISRSLHCGIRWQRMALR